MTGYRGGAAAYTFTKTGMHAFKCTGGRASVHARRPAQRLEAHACMHACDEEASCHHDTALRPTKAKGACAAHSALHYAPVTWRGHAL